jgi:hypothetical protein
VVIAIKASRSTRRVLGSTSISSQAVSTEITTASASTGSASSRNPKPQARSARISASAAMRPIATITPNRNAIGTV